MIAATKNWFSLRKQSSLARQHSVTVNELIFSSSLGHFRGQLRVKLSLESREDLSKGLGRFSSLKATVHLLMILCHKFIFISDRS